MVSLCCILMAGVTSWSLVVTIMLTDHQKRLGPRNTPAHQIPSRSLNATLCLFLNGLETTTTKTAANS